MSAILAPAQTDAPYTTLESRVRATLDRWAAAGLERGENEVYTVVCGVDAQAAHTMFCNPAVRIDDDSAWAEIREWDARWAVALGLDDEQDDDDRRAAFDDRADLDAATRRAAVAGFTARRDMPVASSLHGAVCCLLEKGYTDGAIEDAVRHLSLHGTAQCLDVATILDSQADVDDVEATLVRSPDWNLPTWDSFTLELGPDAGLPTGFWREVDAADPIPAGIVESFHVVA